jgi:hypothetical protein
MFDRLMTPRWLPILLFWAFVRAGLGIAVSVANLARMPKEERAQADRHETRR